MTFEQLLVKYLYQHKQLTLQGFGTVTLGSNVPDAEFISKNRQVSIEGVNFAFNAKAVTEPGFVQFFSQQKGKIKPLAESDIESHLQLARQLMNIGKPYEVEGLGLFIAKPDGGMILQAGHYSIPVNDNVTTANRLRDRTQEETTPRVPEDEEGGVSSGAKKGGIILGVVILLCIAGWFAWSKMQPAATETAPPQDTTAKVIALDTVPLPVDSSKLADSARLAADTTALWKAYFRTFSGASKIDSVKQRYRRVDSTLQVETLDSNTFRLYVVVKGSAADTAALRDSLKRVFLRPVTLERKQP